MPSADMRIPVETVGTIRNRRPVRENGYRAYPPRRGPARPATLATASKVQCFIHCPPPRMKILHTSDWHIGNTLYGKKRYAEFETFLAWLTQTIKQHQVDTLLVAGDVFDNTAPSHHMQEIFYRVLAISGCRHAAVIGGNHDSPSFLDAPKELLKALDIRMIGALPENPDDEILVLRCNTIVPELIVCAVPFLRDRNIRQAEAGESLADKERKLGAGIRQHYAAQAARAEEIKKDLGAPIPIVAMGHLFTAGGVEGDGERPLYVGSLAQVTASIFPPVFDYVALGHLHVPQKVKKQETIRYCGSPCSKTAN